MIFQKQSMRADSMIRLSNSLTLESTRSCQVPHLFFRSDLFVVVKIQNRLRRIVIEYI